MPNAPKPRFLRPSMLEADTTVPQCLDNQFVSEGTFTKMAQNPTLDYGSPEIAHEREQEARTELRRALVYSSQIVVNRAFFVNSPILYGNYLPDDRSGIRSFAKLLEANDEPQAIVPYLHTGHYLSEPLPFKEDDRGRQALKALLEYAGEPVSVRFHENDTKNEKAVRGVESKFATYLKGQLHTLTGAGYEDDLNDMAAELFGPGRERIEDPGSWERFRMRLRSLAEFSGQTEKLSRSSVYEHMLVRGETPTQRKENTAKGRFRDPETVEGEFVFEVKKLVDLVYNTNLPDQMHRYTFTPSGLPTRVALQDFTLSNSEAETDVVEEAGEGELKDHLNQIFMANAQHAMALPILSSLTIADIVEIRKLPKWHKFSKAQQEVLQHPLEILDRLEAFTAAFNQFQSELSRWYFRKYELAKKAERYANFATVALQIGGSTLVALGFPGVDAASVLSRSAVAPVIPLVCKPPTIKLMVYVVDLVRRCIDPARSYSIDLMQTQTEYTRDQVLDLLRKFNGDTEGIQFEDRYARLLSDQGK